MPIYPVRKKTPEAPAGVPRGTAISNGVKKDYLKTIKERSKESKVYRGFQLIGLEIADLLEDREHKSLYIKLAKQYDSDKLLGLAKDIATRENVQNKGAYFMTVVQNLKKDKELRTKPKPYKNDKNGNSTPGNSNGK